MDIQKQLFEIALKVEEPVYIERIEFDGENGELHMYMNFRRGGKFSCPICGELCPVHDTTEKVWRHLNFFQYKCFIHFRTPNTKCDKDGVHLFVPEWGRTRSGFTMLFEAFVLLLAKEMPISSIAELVGEHDTRIWRIVKAHAAKAYAEKDMSGVRQVGIDETSSAKGHKYVSVFLDMEKHEVLFATEGKDASVIGKFIEEMPRHNGNPDEITDISMDMSPAFISGADEKLPNANVTFDKFHVMKQLNVALDEVRRNEQKKNPLLKGSRYVWLKNPCNLTEKQAKDLITLSKENNRLAKAYQMKLTFSDIYRFVSDYDSADMAIKKWLSWAVRSRLEPIKSFARTVKEHYHGILQFFISHLTAGASEGMNSRIQEIKRRAKGFRNIVNFIAMIYIEGANLILPAWALPT